MEKEMEVPLIIVEPNDDDYDKENLEINVQRSSQGFEHYHLNNNSPPHNSKKITKIVCSSDTNYVVTFSKEDKSIHGWPIHDDDFEDEKEGKTKELRYNSRFQKDELSDLLMVSNDRYALVRISKKEQDEFRIVKLDEKENEIFYVKGNPAYDQGTFISSNNDFFIIYKKELEAYVYHTSQVIVNKREMEHNRDITTIWQLKSKYKFVFPQQFWQKEIRPAIGFFLTSEKLFLTYKGSNILSQWDLSTMTFEKQYLLELNKRNVHPAMKVDDDIFELKQTMVVDGSKKNIMAIHGYSTFNFEHQILVYSMVTELKISSYTIPSENSTSNISIVGTSKNDGGLLIYGFNGEQKPEYFLHDLNDLDFCENAETISSIIPDQVDAQLVVNKELSDKIVIAKDSKLIVYNISEEELKMLRDKLKLKKLKKDQSDKTFKYYPYPYPSSIVKTLFEMLEGLDWNRSAVLPAEYACKELDSIKWSVNHWRKTGKTSIKVSELTYVDNESGKKLCEWKDLDEFKYFPPREIFVFACRCIENGDLIMITKQGIRIFTIIRPSKKIKMRYFWDNDRWREAWKSSKKLERPFDFEGVKVGLSRRRNKLPPLDINRLIELYETFYIENNYRIWPFKDLLRNYLQDTTTLAKYGKKVLYKAIDAKKGNIVELICNMCINFLEKDSDNFYLLRIIVKCLPKLQQNYPEIVAEFMAKSSMILDHQCFIVTNSEYTLIHGYSRDVMIYEKNTFWDHYHQIQFFYYKVYNIIKNIIETISGGEEEEKFGIPVVVFLIPLYKFSSFSTNFDLYYDIYNPKSNGFVDMHYPAFYKEWNAEALLNFKWHTYGKYYYYTHWTWFLIYLLMFAIGTTVSPSGLSTEMRHILLSASIIIGFVFFTFEIRDFLWRPRKYLKNFWNLFDCGAYLFPIITSMYWLKYGKPPLWLPTCSNLLVDLKFLLFFRVFESYGRYFAIMLGVAKHVFSFVMILFIIIISFAHAFYILLTPQREFDLNSPVINDDRNNPWLLTDQYYQINPDGSYSKSPVLVKQPDSSTNMFAWPQTSLLAMYLLLTGDQSSLSAFPYLDRHSLAVLTITFSFFTVIYLMNLFIGLLNNAIEVNNDHANYLIEKSRIIGEIELFHLFPHQRRWRTWFPDVIYYEVPVDEVRKQIHQLDNTARSSSNYSPIISSRLRDIVDVPKSYNQQQQDLLSEFEAINSFLKKINGEGIHRQFSISSIGNTSKLFKPGSPGTPGTREIKTYFSDPDGTYID